MADEHETGEQVVPLYVIEQEIASLGAQINSLLARRAEAAQKVRDLKYQRCCLETLRERAMSERGGET